MSENKSNQEKNLICNYYNKKPVSPKEGKECYTFEPENHDAYTCVTRACGACYYSKKA